MRHGRGRHARRGRRRKPRARSPSPRSWTRPRSALALPACASRACASVRDRGDYDLGTCACSTPCTRQESARVKPFSRIYQLPHAVAWLLATDGSGYGWRCALLSVSCLLLVLQLASCSLPFVDPHDTRLQFVEEKERSFLRCLILAGSPPPQRRGHAHRAGSDQGLRSHKGRSASSCRASRSNTLPCNRPTLQSATLRVLLARRCRSRAFLTWPPGVAAGNQLHPQRGHLRLRLVATVATRSRHGCSASLPKELEGPRLAPTRASSKRARRVGSASRS